MSLKGKTKRGEHNKVIQYVISIKDQKIISKSKTKTREANKVIQYYAIVQNLSEE